MKTEKQTKSLLEKYYSGQTTLEEERLLRELLAVGTDDPDAKDAADMMGFFAQEAKAEPSAGIMRSVRAKYAAGRSLPRGGRRIWMAVASCAAAGILAAVLLFRGEPQPEMYACVDGRIITDPQQVAEQSRRILAKINIYDINDFNGHVAKGFQAMDKLDAVSRAMHPLRKVSAEINISEKLKTTDKTEKL